MTLGLPGCCVLWAALLRVKQGERQGIREASQCAMVCQNRRASIQRGLAPSVVAKPVVVSETRQRGLLQAVVRAQ